MKKEEKRKKKARVGWREIGGGGGRKRREVRGPIGNAAMHGGALQCTRMRKQLCSRRAMRDLVPQNDSSLRQASSNAPSNANSGVVISVPCHVARVCASFRPGAFFTVYSAGTEAAIRVAFGILSLAGKRAVCASAYTLSICGELREKMTGRGVDAASTPGCLFWENKNKRCEKRNRAV